MIRIARFFRFHESLWQLQNRPDYKVTREVLMVALQNLQYILVKASDNAEFTRTTYVLLVFPIFFFFLRLYKLLKIYLKSRKFLEYRKIVFIRRYLVQDLSS